MAKVEKLLPGKDGTVRAVVRTLNKAKRPVSLKGAVRQLYTLEVSSDAQKLNYLGHYYTSCVADQDVQGMKQHDLILNTTPENRL